MLVAEEALPPALADAAFSFYAYALETGPEPSWLKEHRENEALLREAAAISVIVRNNHDADDPSFWVAAASIDIPLEFSPFFTIADEGHLVVEPARAEAFVAWASGIPGFEAEPLLFLTVGGERWKGVEAAHA